MIIFIRRTLLLLLAAFLLSLSAFTQWQTIGRVTSWKEIPGGIELLCGQAAVRVTAVSDNVIRVRCSPAGTYSTDRSWAVVEKPGGAAKHVREAGDAIELSTPSLTARINRNPCRISFFSQDGTLLNSDDSLRGISWSGSEIVNWKSIPAGEHYYGLGEKSNELEKSGSAVSMWNSDIPAYTANTDPLYQDIPFFYGIRNGKAYGIFFDNTYYSFFNFGKEDPTAYSFGATGGEMNYYFLAGPTPAEVMAYFTTLTGPMPFPPRWALGYQQCRWSYYPESRVREIADNFRKRDIPCDVIYLDIHYMDGYRCFTWDSSRFADPKRMIGDLEKDGFKVVVIIDPGIKIDSNYFVYREGLKGDYFVKKADGKPFEGTVWPGNCVFPDFTNPKARDWWGSLYKGYMSDGIAGFWNDMNEPSVFNGVNKTMDLSVVHNDDGQMTDHRKNHNIYGMQMARGTYEGMLKLRPDERPFVLTRANYAGGQRYAAAWTGDNVSSWEHLRLSLTMCLSLSISGQPFVGSDIGGFIGMPSGELYARWLQLGVFTPLMRSHSEINSPNKEPWEYGPEFEKINRETIRLRYRFLPYIYRAFRSSPAIGKPMMRPLFFDFPEDGETIWKDDEFLFGADLLVAPVLGQGVTQRDVYLPEGRWVDFWSGTRYDGRRHVTVDAPLDRLPLFVKAGSIIPTGEVVSSTEHQSEFPVNLMIFPDSGRASGRLYEDDGKSFAYQRGESLTRHYAYVEEKGQARLRLVDDYGHGTPSSQELRFEVQVGAAVPSGVVFGDATLKNAANPEVLRSAQGWHYDQARKILRVHGPNLVKGKEYVVRFRGGQDAGK